MQLDIMDRGTDACNFLLGKVVPLKLGYVGVVNRCQEVLNAAVASLVWFICCSSIYWTTIEV